MPGPTTAFANRELPAHPVAAKQVATAITGQSTYSHSAQSPVTQPSGTQPITPTPFPDSPDTGAVSRTSTFTAAAAAITARLNVDLGAINGWVGVLNSLVPAGGVPTLTTVAPATGPLAGGTAVTLTGTNFTGSTGVLFGTRAATSVVVVSATSITCVSPAGVTPGVVVGVTVQNPNGNAIKAGSFTYAGSPATVSAVVPNVGRIAGGLITLITGSGYTGSTGVTFGGTAATGVVILADSAISCLTPAHAAGAVNVVVTDAAGNGTLTNGFTYS
jgi:hypothetical protein